MSKIQWRYNAVSGALLYVNRLPHYEGDGLSGRTRKGRMGVGKIFYLPQMIGRSHDKRGQITFIN